MIQLIDEKDLVDAHLKAKKHFTEEMITVDSLNLEDTFLSDKFDINIIKEYFDDDAWIAVEMI